MAGGLLNLQSYGDANVLIHGNPSKTFFKCAYSKITNFGLQKFRLDYDGSRDLRLTESSKFTFKVKHYADLLMDTYLVVTLPDIWSPIYSPSKETNYLWCGYDFRWIRELGYQMIQSIEIQCGSTVIQSYTGQYLATMIHRDFPSEKKHLVNQMIGNIPELYDPANALGRENAYPSAYYTTSTNGAEPSIRGQTLYIPLNAWFTLDSRCAFPLISLQYQELSIHVTLRPIQDLFQVRDVQDPANQFPYVRPDFNQEYFRMYRFLQTPPAVRTDTESGHYTPYPLTWNADIHLMGTYCFLSAEERQQFAMKEQLYLIKEVIEYKFPNIMGSTRLKLEHSLSLVSNWMWFFQRNDIHLRNEWSNYTNWPYHHLPSNCQMAPGTEFPNLIEINQDVGHDGDKLIQYGPRIQPWSTENTGIFITGDYSVDNQKRILQSFGILLEGDYRENLLPEGIYHYLEKYVRTSGSGKEGLYNYHFGLTSDCREYQPTGGMNLTPFQHIELEVVTFLPQKDVANQAVNVVCDSTGHPVAISTKPSYQLYQYSYDMTLYEERYNILSFVSGLGGLMFSR